MSNNASQVEPDPQIVDVTITAPDADRLRQHCATLIEQRLAASANIIPAIDSIYRWQGEIHRATEAYAIVHTTMACVDRIAELTNQAHPYDTVHILASRSDVTDSRYEEWVINNVGPRSS